VLWSLSAAALSRQLFESAGHFCVHVLTSEQEELSKRFASRGADKFGGLKWSPGLGSVPMLEEYVARFQCKLTHQYPIGDHIVFVGEVLCFDKSDRRPLVFHAGRYALAERRMMEKLAHQLGEAALHGEDRRKGR
jgi:3-hydroxy-9,10-secoandrosta-1,3,5(10)-triene-9,17-dione monooxygenase reductase component